MSERLLFTADEVEPGDLVSYPGLVPEEASTLRATRIVNGNVKGKREGDDFEFTIFRRQIEDNGIVVTREGE